VKVIHATSIAIIPAATLIEGNQVYYILLIHRSTLEVVGQCQVYETNGNGVISEVFVNEKYRGKGFGKELLDEAERMIKEQLKRNTAYLFVAKDNDAREMYKKRGYQDTGERTPIDQIWMGKILE